MTEVGTSANSVVAVAAKARVACPMCETVMAQAKVFDHIQTCDGKKKDSPASSSNAGWAGFMSSTQAGRTAPLPSSKLLARQVKSLSLDHAAWPNEELTARCACCVRVAGGAMTGDLCTSP